MAEMVTLTPEELAEVIMNATGRQGIKERHGIQTKKISDKLTDEELHVLEVKAQRAVSKHFNVPMDWSICVGGNRNPHFVINGISMRVQTATHHPPILKLNRAEDFTTDLMIVCMEWPDEPAVIAIYGCVSRERFLREHSVQDFGQGKRLVMRSWELTPIADYQAEAAPPKKAVAAETAPASQQLKKDVG
jgi:hypothetical protein